MWHGRSCPSFAGRSPIGRRGWQRPGSVRSGARFLFRLRVRLRRTGMWALPSGFRHVGGWHDASDGRRGSGAGRTAAHANGRGLGRPEQCLGQRVLQPHHNASNPRALRGSDQITVGHHARNRCRLVRVTGPPAQLQGDLAHLDHLRRKSGSRWCRPRRLSVAQASCLCPKGTQAGSLCYSSELDNPLRPQLQGDLAYVDHLRRIPAVSPLAGSSLCRKRERVASEAIRVRAAGRHTDCTIPAAR